MIRAIRAARHGRAAVSEVRAGRIAERPPAHRLLQLEDGHPNRHRQHDALVSFRFSLDLSPRRDRERCRAANNARGDRNVSRRGGAVDSVLGRGRAGTRSDRTRGLGAACQTQPMNFADHGVAGQSVTEQHCDLTRALALDPVLPELLHSFVRPGHCRLVRHFLRLQAVGFAQNPSPRPTTRSSGKTRTRILSEALAHDISWPSTERLHYSLNRAQESIVSARPAFQQVSASRRARRPLAGQRTYRNSATKVGGAYADKFPA